MQIQFDLFEDNTEMGRLKREVLAYHEESERVRRGIFARHSELAKLYLELKAEYEILKQQIRG